MCSMDNKNTSASFIHVMRTSIKSCVQILNINRYKSLCKLADCNDLGDRHLNFVLNRQVSHFILQDRLVLLKNVLNKEDKY